MEYTVTGIYGRGTPCDVHCYSIWGGTWYAVDGSHNVNFCPNVVLEDGVDVEVLNDTDTATSAYPVTCPHDVVNIAE